MLVEVLKHSLHKSPALTTSLSELTDHDGSIIGKGLALPVAINLTNDAAIEEWFARYPAMKHFAGEDEDGENWFRPMMEIMAGKLLTSTAWGMKSRVFFGGSVRCDGASCEATS